MSARMLDDGAGEGLGGGVGGGVGGLRLGTLIVAGMVPLAAALAWAPLATVGGLVGAALLVGTIAYPLGVITLMLVLGPLDLAFVTGGFKSLFEGFGGLDMNGIRLLAVSAGLAVILAWDTRFWPRLRERDSLIYLIFLAFAAATLAMSSDPGEGIRLLVKLAWPLLFFLVVSGPERRSTDIEKMIDWLLVGGVVLMLVNPLFILRGDVYVELGGEVRLQGAGTHQNPFSFYMLAVALVALGRFVSRLQVRYLAVVVGAAVWMGLTLTRITFLAGLVSLAVVSLYAVVVRRNFRAAVVGLLTGAVLALALTPIMMERTFGAMLGPGEILELFRDPIRLYQTINWSGRELFWAVLAAAWSTSPLIGLGLGSSSGILKGLFTRDMGQVAHNEYLRIGTDTGVVGVGLFAAACGIWAFSVARLGRDSKGQIQEVALPALALVVAWGVLSITDNSLDYYNAFTQYVGVLVAATVVVGRETRSPWPEGVEPERVPAGPPA